MGVDDRLRSMPSRDSGEMLFEVVLHADAARADDYILEGFEAYAEGLDAAPDLARRLYAGGLCFLPLRAKRSAIRGLAQYSFLRVVRPMPTLRPVQPARPTRSVPSFRPFKVEL